MPKVNVNRRPGTGGSKWRLQFEWNGLRRTMSMGALSERKCQQFADRLEDLMDSRSRGLRSSPVVVEWLAGMGGAERQRLEEWGLVDAAPRKWTFIQYVEHYYDRKRNDPAIKDSTKETWPRSINHAKQFFLGILGKDPLLSEFKKEHVENLKNYIAGLPGRTSGRSGGQENMSPATVAKAMGVLSAAMNDAVENGLMERNPFRLVAKGKMTNPKRQVYVPAEVVKTLMAKTDDPELRVLLALSRFGGVRVGDSDNSEFRLLRWKDLGKEHLHITSPKTERYEGKGQRFVPLFVCGSLFDLLRQLKPHGANDEDFILPTLKGYSQPWMLLGRLVKESGFKPWPKLWHNLRASCITDWLRHLSDEGGRYSLGDLAKWAGHTVKVMAEHYVLAKEGGMIVEVGGPTLEDVFVDDVSDDKSPPKRADSVTQSVTSAHTGPHVHGPSIRKQKPVNQWDVNGPDGSGSQAKPAERKRLGASKWAILDSNQ
ncbi:MAG: phage integrase SAM-like domain-containing protein [Phycisphaerae bacterium]